jgi:hypothetical protein
MNIATARAVTTTAIHAARSRHREADAASVNRSVRHGDHRPQLERQVIRGLPALFRILREISGDRAGDRVRDVRSEFGDGCGSSFRMAPINAAWLLPSKARRPLSIS